MGIFTNFLKKIRLRKTAQPESDRTAEIDPNRLDPDPVKAAILGGEQVDTERDSLLKIDPLMAYKIGAYYYACVESVMNALTPVPFMVKDKDGEVTDKNEFLNGFLKVPGMLNNEPVTWDRMLKRYIQNRYIFGGSHFELLKEETGSSQFPIGIHALKRPDLMDFNAETEKWEYTAGPENVEFTVEQIKTLAKENPESDTDMVSPIQAMPASFNMLIGAAKFNKALFDNRAAIGGVIAFDHMLRTNVYKRLMKNLEGIVEKAGKWLILETQGGGKAPTVDSRGSFGGAGTTIDGGYPNLRKDIKSEILAVTGVTPIMIGEQESQTYHNASLQWKTFWQMTGGAILDDITEFLNIMVLPMMDPTAIDGCILAYDEDYIKAMWQDIEQKHKQLDNQSDRAVITPNEYRESIGLQPVADDAMNAHYLKGIPITFSTGKAIVPAINDDGSLVDAEGGEAI